MLEKDYSSETKIIYQREQLRHSFEMYKSFSEEWKTNINSLILHSKMEEEHATADNFVAYQSDVLCRSQEEIELMQLENSQIPFLNTHLKNKLSILDIPNTRTCFVTKKDGDNIVQVYMHPLNQRGSTSKWNMVPVHDSIKHNYCTFSYKNFNYNMFTDFVDPISSYIPLEKLNTWKKIKKWREYCDQYGATLYWD